MIRKLVVTAFLLALCWMPKTAATQFGAACTQHVCYICAQGGLVCVSKPYCHCE